MLPFPEEYWQKWIEKEREVFAKGQRSYLHFDRKIHFDKKLSELKKFLSSAQNVARHDFYPLIRRVAKTPRYKHSDDKKRKIKVKKRPICYTAHFDTLIYSWYAFLLAERYEVIIRKEGIENYSSAYRRLGKSNVDFALEAFEYIQLRGECAVIALDVKGFFDNLEHGHLKKAWSQVLGVDNLPPDHFTLYRSLTQFCYVNRATIFKHLNIDLKKRGNRIFRLCDPQAYRSLKKKIGLVRVNSEPFGIPQGAAISAVLSNIYMMEFDKTIGGIASEHNLYYRRYCDDILLVCQPNQVDWLKKVVYETIGRYGLRINVDKEETVYFRYKSPEDDAAQCLSINRALTVPYRRLQYLGFEFDGRNIYIRPPSLARYYRKMKKGVKQAVKRSFGNNSVRDHVYKKKLYSRFTHLGKFNFISYALGAFKRMRSESIRKQIASHTSSLQANVNTRVQEHLA